MVYAADHKNTLGLHQRKSNKGRGVEDCIFLTPSGYQEFIS